MLNQVHDSADVYCTVQMCHPSIHLTFPEQVASIEVGATVAELNGINNSYHSPFRLYLVPLSEDVRRR